MNLRVSEHRANGLASLATALMITLMHNMNAAAIFTDFNASIHGRTGQKLAIVDASQPSISIVVQRYVLASWTDD
ncbi:hypothetical protein KC326_g122 [Hortaea werneckii]|nr:hypothetical protein KC326_g122 [Hortaea werneckii]